MLQCDTLLFSDICVNVYVLDGYLAARLWPSFLWDLDGFCLSLGLLQSYPLCPVGRQSAPGSPWTGHWPPWTCHWPPWASHWPPWASHGIFQPASSLCPTQLQSQRKWDTESSGSLHSVILYNDNAPPSKNKMCSKVKMLQPKLAKQLCANMCPVCHRKP